VTEPLRMSFDVSCTAEHAFAVWTSGIGSPRMPLPAGSQCESAPSASVNRTSALPAGSLAYICCDCPGQNCS
jgi:hypothetical protein